MMHNTSLCMPALFLEMPTMLKIRIVFVVLLSCLGTTCCGQESFRYEKKIDALVRPYLAADKFRAVSIAVIADGKVWKGNYGQLSESDKTKPTGDTVYELGSISKVFTSLLLADAINSGDVKLETQIGELMPAIKDTKLGKTITLKHLSTHMSGLPKMPTNISPKDVNNPFADYNRAQLTKYMKSARLAGKPGAKHEYSNVGAGLLGDLLAAKSEQDYESLLQSRILKPLKMNDTSIKLSDSQTKRLAPPHNSALIVDTVWDFDSLAGAGAIRSTTSDMVRFMKANLDSPDNELGKAIDLAWKQHLPAGMGHRAMGLGWQIAGDGSTRWHNGRTGGYQTMMLVSRKLDAGVILLCNTAGSEIDGLGQSIFQTVVGMDPKPITFAKSVKVDESTVKRLAGKYQLAPQIVIEVVAKKDRIVVQLTGQTFLKVVPESDTIWNYVDVEAQLKFDLPIKGPAKKVTLIQNGRKMPAPRIKR